MRRSVQLALACVAFLVTATGQAAAAVVINFDSVPDGPVSSIGDAAFSLAGVGESGLPYRQVVQGHGYLWNSNDGYYQPTNTILKVVFSSSVTDVEFDFNPLSNSASGRGWKLLNAGGATIASGTFFTGLNHYDVSAYAGVKSIEFSTGGITWSQGLNKLSYEPEQMAVPEPSTLVVWSLLGGVGVLVNRAKRRCNPGKASQEIR